MKILLTLLSIFILFSCSPSEIPSNHLTQIGGLAYKVDSKKPYSGVVVDYHQNGQLKKKVNYEQGVIIDNYVEVLMSNGQLDNIYFYINGKENRYVDYIYYENGNIKAKKTYVENILNGLLEEFYDNGKVKLRHTYVNGVLDGPFEEYSEDGKLLFKAEYRSTVPFNKTVMRNGIRYEVNSKTPFTGEIKRPVKIENPWFGDIWWEYEKSKYKNGLLHGSFTREYENGQISESGQYIDGEKEGLYETFCDNGQIIQSTTYVKGEIDGLFERFDCEGNLLEKGLYIKGQPEGLHIEYYWETHMVQYKRNYKNGKLHGLWEEYYDKWNNGKLKESRSYVDGVRVLWVIYATEP